MKLNRYLIAVYFACILGAFAVLPFALMLQNKTITDLTTYILIMTFLQNVNCSSRRLLLRHTVKPSIRKLTRHV